MLTKTDIDKLKKIFTTKKDLKKYPTMDYLDKKFRENNESLIKQIFELLEANNQALEEKFDKHTENLIKQIIELNNVAHERIKVFPISA